MVAWATRLPPRRPDLVVRPLGDHDQYVVKDPCSGEFFHLGAEEHFLLTQLDGAKDAAAVCAAFAERFGQPLSAEELGAFVELARGQRLVQIADCGLRIAESNEGGSSNPQSPIPNPQSAIRNPQSKQSVLYWRKSLFDPDRFCTWLEPRIRFFWTRGFLIFSAGCILLAALLLWANRQELATSFTAALRWETAVLVWLTLLLVTTLHELAHGLTCKHHGGEVHEIGFLLMFFMPCFYCNVSDAWLFQEKSKRLWVTFAGGYFELFLWALAVFVWRLTVPDSLLNYLAFVVLASCGVQTLFNFNPLLKLDGYYLLSDGLEIPNLQQRGREYLTGWLRCLLWGGPRPDREPRGRALLTYGLVSWLYGLVFLALTLAALAQFLKTRWGVLGLAGAAVLGALALGSLFRGVSSGEVRTMIRTRHPRTVMWGLALAGVAGLLLVPMEDRVSGSFQVRPAVRAELRAAVAGFLRELPFDEGDRVSPGAVLARLEVPDLASRAAQKRAEVREAQARLRLLEVGPRPEEVAEQRSRVERATAWRDLARHDLERTRQALAEDLTRLEQQIAQSSAELEAARDALSRRAVAGRGAFAAEEYRDVERRQRVSQAQLEQAQAEKRARQAKGALEAEAELARRDKELADARAALTLLAAGTRPEEVEAERARLARLHEEVRYLEHLEERVQVASRVPGLITTPRLKEKVGQYVREGELICVVEGPGPWEAEITLAEQDVARVRPGQAIMLKARALPFATLQAQVERIAPAAGRGEGQSTVAVMGRLRDGGADLKPGMTGSARIATGRRRLGEVVIDRLLRLLRTEFWW